MKKVNKNYFSASDKKNNFTGVDFERKFSRLKTGRIDLEHLFTHESERNFATVRDHYMKHRIVSEFQKHDKLIGMHRKLQSTQIKNMEDHDLSLMKFRRSPNRERKSRRQTFVSPIKPLEFISNQEHLFALSMKYGASKESLNFDTINDKTYKSLRKDGFVDNKGIANIKFISRYEEVVGTIYPLKHSISSVFQPKNNIRLRSKK